jgi:hypothetical protein
MTNPGQTETTHQQAVWRRRAKARRPVLAALDLFDRKHPVRLTSDVYASSSVTLFARAVRALARDLDDRDSTTTAYQRHHASERAIRSADATTAAARRLSAHYPWLARKVFDLAYGNSETSWRALRRSMETAEGREALWLMRWALRRGRAATASTTQQAAR